MNSWEEERAIQRRLAEDARKHDERLLKSTKEAISFFLNKAVYAESVKDAHSVDFYMRCASKREEEAVFLTAQLKKKH